MRVLARGHGLLALLVILVFGAWLHRSTRDPATPAPARDASVPLAFVRDRLVVNVRTGAPDLLLRFIVDTGAERSAVASRTARRIEAPLLGRTRLLGPGGQRYVPVTSLDALHIGDLVVRRVPALVVESALLGGYDGILGLDVLRLYDVRVDVPAGRLVLLPPRPGLEDRPAGTLRELRGGIVAVDVDLDGVAASAILDTGLPRTLLNPAAARAIGIVERAGSSRRGLDGAAIRTATGTLPRLSMAGTVLLEDVVVDIAEAPLFTAAGLSDSPALLLGADAFRDCAFHIAWTARRLIACAD